jgi:hypothetical protein
MKSLIAVFGLAVGLSVETASAQWTFTATLTGGGENPANASTATGFGTVLLNATQTSITVNESWTGLIGGGATASHIHGPGGIGPTGPTNAAVIFPFQGVPPVTSGSITQHVFTVSAQQVGWLFSGYLYMNVHDSTFPGGEIRGQLLLVPEPSTVALLGLGVGGILLQSYRKRAKQLRG